MLSEKPWISLSIILIGGFIWFRLDRHFKKCLIAHANTATRQTSLNLALMVAKGAVAAFAVIFVLQVNGVDVPGMIAGLGVAGIIVGFALQDLLKDLIMGTAIVWDNTFALGDVIRVGNFEGKVLSFNFKSTKVQDIRTGNVVTFCNRDVATIEVVSDWLDIDVPVAYEVEAADAREICAEVARRCERIDSVNSAEFIGTQELAASSIVYRVRLHCDPASRYAVRRAANSAAQDVFAERDLAFPYDHLDVQLCK
ncbi:mechanosensitive ion channel family protein [Paratractidigestivibacter sp.]|nr:mechanosensitive ion channel family protein [Paratractidigestivibacter sp.]